MRLSVFQKGLLLVAAPLLLELFFFAGSSWLQRKYEDAKWWTDHTDEVIRNAHEVFSSVIAAQTGVRGYLITSNEAFAEPFEKERVGLQKLLAELKDLVRDNPSQSVGANEVEGLAERAIEFQAQISGLVKADLKTKAAEQVFSGEGERRIDALRQRLNEFVGAEQRLSGLRNDELLTVRSSINRLAAGGAITSVVVSVLLVFGFSRGVSRRLATVAENTRLLSAGRSLSPSVGGSDEIAELDRSFRIMASDLAGVQSRLREQGEILQSILDSMGDGVIVADAEGKFLVFNPAGERLFGRGATDAGPSEWSDEYGLFRADRQTRFPVEELPLVRAMSGESCDGIELFVRNAGVPDGRWVEIAARPLRMGSNDRCGGVVVCRDVTLRRQAEEVVRRTNEELERRVGERTAELLDANQDLARKNEENALFVYSVSHDLRSPLVNLLGFSKELGIACNELRTILADERVPSEVKSKAAATIDGDVAGSVHYIENSVRRLSGIIDALLRLSRAGRVQYQMQWNDADSVAARVVAALHGTIAERKAQVVLHPLPEVWGDAAALDQVFANLISNALNYLDPARPGRIEVGALDENAASNQITLYVKDNGRGIPEGAEGKVFQAFQRLHPGGAPGEGIGLTIVRRTIERHGGRIWYESTGNVGTTFFVELPIGPPTSRSPALIPNREPQRMLASHAR